MTYHYKMQLLAIGDTTVGKTSLLGRYCNGIYNTYLATIGLNCFTKDEIIDNTFKNMGYIRKRKISLIDKRFYL